MPVPTARLPVAVVGAGPVGLAAAAHLLERGLVPLVLEAGDQPGANIARWRHVRLFTPWCLALDPAALRLLATTGWTPPDPDALPTGAELLDGYLRPPWPPPPRSPPTCGSAAPWSGSPARTSTWSAPHRAATACRSSCACAVAAALAGDRTVAAVPPGPPTARSCRVTHELLHGAGAGVRGSGPVVPSGTRRRSLLSGRRTSYDRSAVPCTTGSTVSLLSIAIDCLLRSLSRPMAGDRVLRAKGDLRWGKTGAVTRRHFLQYGVGGGAALALPLARTPVAAAAMGGKLAKFLEPVPLPGSGIVVATPSGANQYSFTQTQIARQLHPQLPPT